MSTDQEPGFDRVSNETREFQRIDEQVTAGAGRGPTPAEAAAAEQAPPVADHTREAYRDMVWKGITQVGAGRIA